MIPGRAPHGTSGPYWEVQKGIPCVWFAPSSPLAHPIFFLLVLSSRIAHSPFPHQQGVITSPLASFSLPGDASTLNSGYLNHLYYTYSVCTLRAGCGHVPVPLCLGWCWYPCLWLLTLSGLLTLGKPLQRYLLMCGVGDGRPLPTD